MSLLKKLIKNSTIKETSTLGNSIVYLQQEEISTPIPAINVALSGRLDGGFTPGLTVFAGQSKNFKTVFSLLLAKSFLEKYEDSVLLFYDSEFGAPANYFESFNMDVEKRVVHTPVKNIEELKFDMVKQLNQLEEGEKIIIVIDSIGNLASKKEVTNAETENSAADMTRAKELKSLFRIVTPLIKMQQIPLIVVNHTYKEMGLYPKDIVSGGSGPMLSADSVFIITRQQEKDGTDVVGYKFTINVEKSRFVREKSKIPIEFDLEAGISSWSGLLDIALESGHVVSESKGWYNKKGSILKIRKSETQTEEFWKSILQDPAFLEYIENTYSLKAKLWNSDEDEEEL